MQTFQLPANATVSLAPGSRILLKPSSYIEGEPMVEYAIMDGAVSFALPQRAVNRIKDTFLSIQLHLAFKDVESTTEGVKVRLQVPIFQYPYTFSLVLDHLNRSLDGAATLRQKNMSLTRAQWVNLIEIEKFIFIQCDRNPFWTGLTGQDFRVDGNVCQNSGFRQAFSLVVRPDLITVVGPGGFELKINTTSTTNPKTRPKSLLAGVQFGMQMEFPFPVDFKSSYFIQHTDIQCKIEGMYTTCEGVLHSNGYIRIEPVDAMNFMWFNFEITPRNVHPNRILYGEEV
jgi:hypothetical protein